jgi:hypothetical protein
MFVWVLLVRDQERGQRPSYVNVEPKDGILLARSLESCDLGLESILRLGGLLRLCLRLLSWRSSLALLLAMRGSSLLDSCGRL